MDDVDGCGAPAASGEDSVDRMGPYELLDEIGSGGFGLNGLSFPSCEADGVKRRF
jgi:hypothetical protein